MPPILSDQSKIDDRLIRQLRGQAGHRPRHRREIALLGPTRCQGKPSTKALNCSAPNSIWAPCREPGQKNFSLVQTTGREPDTQPIVHQHFHASGAAIGKQISAVRLRRTEHGHHPRQRCLGAGPHVQGFGGEPDRVDTDHRVRPRTNRANPAGSEAGHVTVRAPCSYGISMLADGSGTAWAVEVSFKGTKAGKSATVLLCLGGSHLRTTLALIPCLKATLETETPGCWHS